MCGFKRYSRTGRAILFFMALSLAGLTSGCAFGGGLRIGAVVATLPAGFVRVSYSTGPLFFHDGFFYRHSGPRYVVVHPPFGIVVPVLPHGVQWVMIGNVRYGHYRGLYYRPIRRNRTTAYMVVDIG